MKKKKRYVIIILSLESWKLDEGGEDMNRYTLAEKIVRLCKEQHMSVTAFAEAIGKSPRQVNRYRSGACKNIPIETLSKIATVLDVCISELLS